MDADQLGVLHSLAEGIDVDENGQAMEAIREVGPGGHYLGCDHTQANFKTAFWRTRSAGLQAVRDLGRGGRARHAGAGGRAGEEAAWPTIRRPALDEGKREELDAFVAQRKEAMPDAFV